MRTDHDDSPQYRHLQPPSIEGERSRLPLWLATAGLVLGAVLLAPRSVTLHAASREGPRASQVAEVETPEVQVRTLPGKPKPAARAVQAAPVRKAPAVRRATAPAPAARSARRRARSGSDPARTAARVPERRIRREQRAAPAVAAGEAEETPRRNRSTRRSGLSAEAQNARAFRLQRQGRHREAEPLLREALRKKPDHAYAQYNLGWSLVRQGKSKEAVLYLKRTSRAQPKRWEPLDKLADAYEQMGEKARAAETRERMESLRGRRSRRSGRAPSADRAQAAPAPTTAEEPVMALSAGAWQQSTDRREEAWFQEKRAGLPLARAAEE